MKLPQHLAIIMDGNGRWAWSRGRARSYGHIRGTRVAKKIISECARLGIKHLTLYAFSTENWFRPKEEVSLLMSLLKRYLLRETHNLIAENISFDVIGDLTKLPLDVLNVIKETEAATNSCTGMRLTFALSYGSRQEILSAIKSIAAAVESGKLSPDEIDEFTVERALWTRGSGDPDLIIRTSGEMRLSNFLLWQAAYSELWFSPVLWPDFSVSDLQRALADYASRERRYGRVGLNEQPRT
ncbi:MAG: isoprenyl transferase [Bdellovibrionaceae bacterium]|nr:isoprenyl transferase [Pseudobdellovibrionaceae bacterium]